MPVIVRLDKIMAERKISSNELAERIGTTPVNLSRIKKGHIRGIRFNTLEQLCLALRCQPGDLLEVMSEEDAQRSSDSIGPPRIRGRSYSPCTRGCESARSAAFGGAMWISRRA